MKMKIFGILALMIATITSTGSDLTKLVDINLLKTLGAEVPRFLKDNRELLQKIYDDYVWLGPAIITYVRGDTPTVAGIASRLSTLIGEILADKNGKELLQFLYKIEPPQAQRLIRVAGGDTVRAAIENYASQKLGVPSSEAPQFARTISALLELMQSVYDKIYKKHIKGQLDDVFATTDRSLQTALLTKKINILLSDPGLREVLFDGLEKIDKQWSFISTKLREYGFDPASLRAFLNRIRNGADELNELLMGDWANAPT